MMQKKLRCGNTAAGWGIAVLLSLLFLLPARVFSDAITDWNLVTLEHIRLGKISNHFGNRTLAMVHGAMFDAVNGITRKYVPFLYKKTAGRSLPPEVAASAAAYTVLKSLYPEAAGSFERTYLNHIVGDYKAAYKSAAVRYGEAVGRHMLAWRVNDGSSGAGSVEFPDGTAIGAWRRTDPMMRPMLPGWGTVKPFGMTSGDQFRLIGPPDIEGYEYARDFNEVKSMGAANSAIRTPAQTETARFWPSGIPHIWNTVAHSVSTEYGYGLEENARLFALLNIALADANIVGWDMKYGFGFWRPVTAITEADYDGNDATAPEPGWTSLIAAPAFPEYVSGHSTSCAVAATVLAEITGSDTFRFTVTSAADPTLSPHTFDGFWAAAKEAGISRVYGGIHFNFSNVEGLEAGRSLGRFLCERLMTPK